MQPADWWAHELRPELSQGDIVGPLPYSVAVSPPTYLRERAFKGGVSAFEKAAGPPTGKENESVPLLAKGRVFHGMVLSHDCEIDKVSRPTARVLVAPVIPLDTMPEELRGVVLRQEKYALMPLPDVPSLWTGYADFRLITSVSRATIDAAGRMASLSETARERLEVQLAAFFVRRERGDGL